MRAARRLAIGLAILLLASMCLPAVHVHAAKPKPKPKHPIYVTKHVDMMYLTVLNHLVTPIQDDSSHIFLTVYVRITNRNDVPVNFNNLTGYNPTFQMTDAYDQPAQGYDECGYEAT